MTNKLETSAYIDFSINNNDQTPPIILDPQYIGSSESNNFATALGFLAQVLFSKVFL